MGAINSPGANITFLNLSLGKLRTKVKSDTPGAQSRVNKNNETVHELVYDGWRGMLQSIESRKTDFGTEIQLTVNDGTEVAKIGMQHTSDYFLDFANRLLSFTPQEIATKEIEIKPFSYNNIKDGKDFTNNYVGLNLPGEDKTRQRRYTKDSPGEMPEWEQVQDPKTGGLIWSQLKQRKWLTAQIKELMDNAAKLRPENPFPDQGPNKDPQQQKRDANEALHRNQPSTQPESPEQPPMGQEYEDDDLPF